MRIGELGLPCMGRAVAASAWIQLEGGVQSSFKLPKWYTRPFNRGGGALLRQAALAKNCEE